MRTPCQKDIEATREMLSLVASKKYQDMFNDQCTVKIRVWKRICEELMAKGFRISDSVNEGGIKCHQKWRNLEKSYRNFLISSTDPNSTVPKKPPPYFEALHEILKKKKKYANAATYTTQTVVVSDDMIDPGSAGSGGGGGGDGLQNHHHHHHHHVHNESDGMDDMDDMEGTNDDHCYVVNSAGHVSKRRKVDPLTVCSTAGGDNGGVVLAGSPRSSRKLFQQPDVLEQILEQMVRVHRDTLAMHEHHYNRMEKLIKDQTAQTRRLADVMCLLHNGRTTEDGGKSSDKPIGTANSSDAE